MGLQLMLADITREAADAVVTPASREKRIGIGVDAAIHRAAGPRLLDERKKLGPIGPGIVHSTPSFGLKRKTGAKYVIHCLGPVYDPNLLHDNSNLALAYTYLLVLLKAKSLGCRTVAIPLLSSGNFGMPVKLATDIAVDAIESYLEADRDMTVKLVSVNPEFLDYAVRQYGKRLKVVSAFKKGEKPPRSKLRTDNRTLTLDEKLKYFKNVVINICANKSFAEALRHIWACHKTGVADGAGDWSAAGRTKRPAFKTYNDLAGATGLSVNSLRKYMGGSGADAPIPSKDKLVAILAELRTGPDIAEMLLKKAGHPLAPGNRRDAIIKRYLAERDDGVAGLQAELHAKGETPLAVQRPRGRRG